MKNIYIFLNITCYYCIIMRVSMSENSFEYDIPEEFKSYITYKYGSFSVRNENRKSRIFFRSGSQDVACAAANLLIKHNWNMAYVKEDPLASYNDEFYVFKLINNELVFDSKFDSFESAVEYVEIYSVGNDDHNDILPNKKRKPKYDKSKIDSQVGDTESSNVFTEQDKIIVKSRKGTIYGVFDSIDEATVAKQILIKNKWKLNSISEIEFHNSFYWVFQIEDNKLIFIDKFEAYEDALDCLDTFKDNVSNTKQYSSVFGGYIEEIDDEYIENIKKEEYVTTDNFVKSVSDESRIMDLFEDSGYYIPPVVKKKSNRSNGNRKTPRKKSVSSNSISEEDILKIIRSNIKIKNVEEDISEKAESLSSELNIMEFRDNNLNDYYTISSSLNGEYEFSNNFSEFDESEYILKFLKFNGMDLNKIQFLSSIHYYNGHYYIIKVFNNKLIVSGVFDSYEDAENNIEFLYGYYSKSLENEKYPHDIEHHGIYFELSENHNGKTFEFSYFKSLEDLKSVIDIFEYFEWNPEVFKEYDLFYYKGIYWDIKYFYYNIELNGRFDSKEDALDHKSK